MGLPASYTRINLVMQDTTTQAVARCTLWYEKTAGTNPTASDIDLYAEDFLTAYTAAVPGALPTAVSLVLVEMIFKSGAAYIDGVSTSTGPAGGVSGDYLPERSAVVIQKRTGQAGRDKRGRIFFPFVPESFQNKGLLTSAARVAYAALATMVKNPITAQGATFEPRHLDFKLASLIPLLQTRYLEEVMSRRDRSYPKRPLAVSP